MSNLTSVAIPVPLLKRARELGINVSKTSREAVADAVMKSEKELMKNKKVTT
jgi:post-segregation antitoxin (ccd killing protein)